MVLITAVAAQLEDRILVLEERGTCGGGGGGFSTAEVTKDRSPNGPGIVKIDSGVGLFRSASQSIYIVVGDQLT